MKKSLIALSVLSVMSATAAHATPAADIHFANGWDLETVQGQTNGIITDNSDRISKLTGDVHRGERENLLRDDKIKLAGDKADAALQGVATN